MKQHILIIPGLDDSDLNHWQSFWLDTFVNAEKLIQKNWSKPELTDWLEKLNSTISILNSPTYLVAHSLGACLVAHWANKYNNPNIKGAMLVAPADVNSPEHTPDIVRNFAPIPLTKITFPSIVVASTNDPFIDIHRAEYFATHWGSDFVNIGAKGHVNSDSNLQFWEEGQLILKKLINDKTSE